MPLSLKTERAPLLAALGTILKTVERTHVIPVLGHLLITASGEHITVAGTDLDIQVEAVLPATVELAGSVTVPAQAFRDLVRKAPEREALRIADDADKRLTTISAGKARATVPGLDVADFPDLRALANDGFTHQFTLAGSKLAALLDRCDFAISTEETRYYLNGIYCHVFDAGAASVLRLVATDGSRLAQITAPLPADLDPSMPGIIIPRKTVALIRDLAAGAGDNDVRIACSRKAISIASGALVITSKLIDGTFPDYQRVIPAPGGEQARVPAKAVARILDFCATLSLEKTRAVKLAFDDGQLAVSLRNNDGGEVRDEVEIEFTGRPFEAGFNASFLSEILESVGTDTVLLELYPTPGSPVRIGNHPDEALFVLMPMRI